MSKIKGIYAAGLSILNTDLSLNVEKTILHSEKIINQGCHGVVIFGSTGQAQLISITEKINLLNQLSVSKFQKNFIIGTGLNSLSETINMMKIAISLDFKKFLIMPPAYFEYEDNEVIDFANKTKTVLVFLLYKNTLLIFVKSGCSIPPTVSCTLVQLVAS